jgi:sporulation protein YlmC with PRC-barrel domain
METIAEKRIVRYTDIVPVKKTVIGSKVVNAQNEDLGKIEDLVIDAGAGRIAYAVLSFGGFLGMGDKYFAIPWNAFRFNLAEKHAVLHLDKCPSRRKPPLKKRIGPSGLNRAAHFSSADCNHLRELDDLLGSIEFLSPLPSANTVKRSCGLSLPSFAWPAVFSELL